MPLAPSKRSAKPRCGAAIDDERSTLSYRGHTGDSAALKRLSKLAAERTTTAATIQELEYALAQADSQLAAAEAAAATAAMRRRATEARAIMAKVQAQAEAIDSGLAQARVGFEDFQSIMIELMRLGAGPSATLVEANTTRALDAGLMGLDRHRRVLAPSERRSFGDLAAAWELSVDTWARRTLGEQGSPLAANEPPDAVMTPQPSKAAPEPSMATA
jgi:hypothetical protein